MANNILDPRVGVVMNLFTINVQDGTTLTAAFVAFDDDSYVALDVTGSEVKENDAITVSLDLKDWDLALAGPQVGSAP